MSRTTATRRGLRFTDTLRPATGAAAVFLLAACGGFFGTASSSDDPAAPATRARSELDRTSARAVAQRMQTLSTRLETASSDRRAELALERGLLAFDASILHDVLSATDPIGADAWLDALRSAWPGEAMEDPWVRAARIAQDLETGRTPPLRIARVRAAVAPTPDLEQPELLWLSWAEEDPTIAPHLRLRALRSAMRHAGTWARGGTGYGGGAMVRECSFLCGPGAVAEDVGEQAMQSGYGCPPVDAPAEEGERGAWAHADEAERWALAQPGTDGWDRLAACGPSRYLLPATPEVPTLVGPENFLDATVLLALADLIASVKDDLDRGEPVSVAAGRLVSEAIARRETTAVPAVLTANLFDSTVTLDLPRVLLPPHADDTALLVRAPRLRTVWVHSHEVRLAVHPSLRASTLPADLSTPQLEWADRALGYGWPGESVASMERAGAIAPDAVVDGAIPALAEALGRLDERLREQVWVPPEEVPDARPDVSLFVDGGVYLSTLVPIVETLRQAGFDRALVHAWHDELQRPVILPLRIAATVGDDTHLLVVRADGFVLQPWDPARMDAGEVISRLDGDGLVRLHQLLVTSRASGRIDPARRLAVRVDDLSTDLGTLSHVVLALAWERDVEGVTTDAQLLAAPIRREGGRVVELAGHGMVVAPE
jgi:hypothetical protein